MEYRDKKNGYSLILVPIAITIIFCFVALVIDIGRVLIIRFQLQSVVDSASIAGASMIKVEYPFDGKNYDFTKTKITLLEDKAIVEADKYFEKNIGNLVLDNRGVKILEKKSQAIDGNRFQYYIKVQIPVSLMAKMIGTNGIQKITIISESEAVD